MMRLWLFGGGLRPFDRVRGRFGRRFRRARLALPLERPIRSRRYTRLFGELA